MGKLLRVEGMMDETNQGNPKSKSFPVCKRLSMEQRLIFQLDNDPEHTAKSRL